MGVFEGGGGGGGLTWPLVLRIFGMVSITFFFAPPSGEIRILISSSYSNLLFMSSIAGHVYMLVLGLM